VVVAVLAVTAWVLSQQDWLSGDTTTTAAASPSVLATEQTAAPTETSVPPSATSSSGSPSEAPASSESSGSGTASESTGVEPSGQGTDAAAQEALESCRAEVRAADETLQAAEVGIGHWAEHVQAQTDANSGKISTDAMDAIFKRTRLAGPDDVERYQKAVDRAKDLSGSCQVPADAPSAVQEQLQDCSTRAEEQQQVLRAADRAMGDWKSHLAAMQRSRMGHVDDPQGVWIRAWREAPPNIEAYQQADRTFDAPEC